MTVRNILANPAEHDYEVINRDHAGEEVPLFQEAPAEEAGPSHGEGVAGIPPSTGRSTPRASREQAIRAQRLDTDARIASLAGSAVQSINSADSFFAGASESSADTSTSNLVMRYVDRVSLLEEKQRNNDMMIELLRTEVRTLSAFIRENVEKIQQLETANKEAAEKLQLEKEKTKNAEIVAAASQEREQEALRKASDAEQREQEALAKAESLQVEFKTVKTQLEDFQKMVLAHLSKSVAIVDGQNAIEGKNLDQIISRTDEIARENMQLKSDKKMLKIGLGVTTAAVLVTSLSGMGVAVPLVEKAVRAAKTVKDLCAANPMTAIAGGGAVAGTVGLAVSQ